MKGIKIKRNNMAMFKRAFLFIFIYVFTVSLGHAGYNSIITHVECTSEGATLDCLEGDYRGVWFWHNGYTIRVSGANTVEIKQNGVSLGHFYSRPRSVSFRDTHNGSDLVSIKMFLDVVMNGVTHSLVAEKQYNTGSTSEPEHYEVSFDGQSYYYSF